MKPGDVNIVAIGCEVPFVIRHIDMVRLEKAFTFVGECYVHGIMDGEAFIEARKSVIERENDDDRAWLQP
jgi:hypothetical protein